MNRPPSSGIDTAFDVAGGVYPGVLCSLHRHCGAFAESTVEQQGLARCGERTEDPARRDVLLQVVRGRTHKGLMTLVRQKLHYPEERASSSAPAQVFRRPGISTEPWAALSASTSPAFA